MRRCVILLKTTLEKDTHYNMKNFFVPYEIASKLKEIGFEVPCLACYDKLNMLATYSTLFEPKNYNSSGYCCSAPTYQQVVDWLREVKNIHIHMMVNPNDLTKYHGCSLFQNKIYQNRRYILGSEDKYYIAYNYILEKTIQQITNDTKEN